MHDTKPAKPIKPASPGWRPQRPGTLRIAVTAAAAAFALGFIAGDLDSAGEAMGSLPRTAFAIAAVALLLWVVEIRIARILSQITSNQAALRCRLDSRLHDAEFAEGYVRGLQRRPPEDNGGWHLHSA